MIAGCGVKSPNVLYSSEQFNRLPAGKKKPWSALPIATEQHRGPEPRSIEQKQYLAKLKQGLPHKATWAPPPSRIDVQREFNPVPSPKLDIKWNLCKLQQLQPLGVAAPIPESALFADMHAEFDKFKRHISSERETALLKEQQRKREKEEEEVVVAKLLVEWQQSLKRRDEQLQEATQIYAKQTHETALLEVQEREQLHRAHNVLQELYIRVDLQLHFVALRQIIEHYLFAVVEDEAREYIAEQEHLGFSGICLVHEKQLTDLLERQVEMKKLDQELEDELKAHARAFSNSIQFVSVEKRVKELGNKAVLGKTEICMVEHSNWEKLIKECQRSYTSSLILQKCHQQMDILVTDKETKRRDEILDDEADRWNRLMGMFMIERTHAQIAEISKTAHQVTASTMDDLAKQVNQQYETYRHLHLEVYDQRNKFQQLEYKTRNITETAELLCREQIVNEKDVVLHNFLHREKYIKEESQRAEVEWVEYELRQWILGSQQEDRTTLQREHFKELGEILAKERDAEYSSVPAKVLAELDDELEQAKRANRKQGSRSTK